MSSCLWQWTGSDYLIQLPSSTDGGRWINGWNRGFGGKCLPKDSNALRVLAEELGVKYDIFDALQSDNARLRGTLTGKASDVETMDD